MFLHISRRHLLKSLGFKTCKIPTDAIMSAEVDLMDFRGEVVLPKVRVLVKARVPGKSHRIDAQCPKCGRFIPFGRLGQHIGKKTCNVVRVESKPGDAGPTTYTLTSTEMVSTPGIFAWAVNGYKFDKDKPRMVRVIADTYGLKDEVAIGLLDGSIPYYVVNDGVQFTYANAKKGQ